VKRPFESFTGIVPDKNHEIFSDKYSPKERRKLWEREYLKIGLEICHGHRDHTAKFLGLSIRCLRNRLRDKHPDLIESIPSLQGPRKSLYNTRKAEFLSKIQEHWHPSKREYIKQELKKIAELCGVNPEEFE